MKYVVKLRGKSYFKRRGYGAHPLPDGEQFHAAYQAHFEESERARDVLGLYAPQIDEFISKAKGNLASAKKRAKKQGVPFEISLEWFEARFEDNGGRCEITGIAFNLDRPKHAPFGPSIDRIEPSLGYTPENCRIVCYIVNCARNQFSDNEFRQMCRAAVRTWDRTDGLQIG